MTSATICFKRVYRYWDTGACGSDIQELDVVRVNRKTVTVRTIEGSVFRIPLAQIVGPVTWENGSGKY